MKKKAKKKHGSRTHGGGAGKKRRGKGHKGGHGFAGVGKRGAQKKSRYLSHHVKPYGKERGSRKKTTKTLNLKQLDQFIDKWLAEDKISKDGDTYSIDLTALGYQKLLGSGTFARKVNIKCKSVSESAKRKIEEAGGVVSG